MIKKLKRTGKIKSTGRSPVPLFLYEEANAKDHLYISSVTKHVPVAHDQQLQSDGSPRNTLDPGSTTRRSMGHTSRFAQESGASPQLAAYQERSYLPTAPHVTFVAFQDILPCPTCLLGQDRQARNAANGQNKQLGKGNLVCVNNVII